MSLMTSRSSATHYTNSVSRRTVLRPFLHYSYLIEHVVYSPELGFEEYKAHDLLVNYMKKAGISNLGQFMISSELY